MGLPNPILRFTDGSKIVDILAPNSGWKMADPYWNPQIAQYKRGGFKINPSIAEGQRLVHKEYDNVVETIPLAAHGPDQNLTIATINELLSLSRQAADFWAESYEFDDVWMEVAPPCEGALIGYARVVQMRIPELINPFGQPFFASFNEAVMEGISLIVEREPLWRAVPPGEIVGPLYNILKNPDFELWNFGITDAQPDSWSDLETAGITGQNSQQSIAPHSGNYALKVAVTGSTAANRFKGVTQILSDTRDSTQYTVVAWVRSDGVSNGVGRILITYASQLEVYRSSTMHGWTLYTGKFTTGTGDIVAINCEILTTAANTVGTVYFDSIMILEGDFEEYAQLGVLPYMTSSHIVNHWDIPGNSLVEAGDINYIDVWDIPGNVDAPVRLEIINNTDATTLTNPLEVISKIRIGMRRTGDVFLFQNWQDPPGINDALSSGNNRINSSALSSTGWVTVSTFSIQTPAITKNNIGRFRAFARVFDTVASGTLTLLSRITYWIGASGTGIKTLDSATVPILNNWCIVDLTPNAGINWDTKGRPDTPSAFGFDLQMKRLSGVSIGQLDYVLLLPTDGGCLISEINPPVLKNQGLIVDNTAQVQSVFGANIISQWLAISETTPAATASDQQEIIDFNNALYIRAFPGSDVYQYKNNVMNLVISAITVLAMTVYNSNLFLFDAGGPASGYACNGTTFSPLAATFTFGNTQPSKAISLGGYIYIAGLDLVTPSAVLYYWNGTAATATLLFQTLTIPAGFTYLSEWNGKLYLSGTEAGTERVYTYDLTFGAFTQILDTGLVNSVTSITQVNNRIWMTNQTDTLYIYDGSTWSTQTLFSVLTPLYYSVNAIDGTLFAVGTDQLSTPDRILVIKSDDDGASWTIDYNPIDTTTAFGRTMTKSQGQLFLGTKSNTSVPAKLHVKSITANEFKVSNYQLIPFYSPPKKRHRFFFNWDRANDINNIDDKALVGLGFVPRYLALRGNR